MFIYVIYVYVHMWSGCTYIHASMEVRGQRWVPPSINLHLPLQQVLSRNLKLTDEQAQKIPFIPLSPFSSINGVMCCYVWLFCAVAREPNSNFHVHMGSILHTKPSISSALRYDISITHEVFKLEIKLCEF